MSFNNRRDTVRNILATIQKLSELAVQQISALTQIRSDVTRLQEFPILLRNNDIVQFAARPNIAYQVQGIELVPIEWTPALQRYIESRQPPPTPGAFGDDQSQNQKQ